ncbi:phasin family protein [Phenylobacterium sp. LjRoot225]|uniref:phasin family protein n=1 Tax=Phenylobacterium sp. LjRoot225 TaxID=3342285 RepID=UPI003ECD70F6
MADVQNTGPTLASKNGGEDAAEAARRVANAGARQAKEGLRAAETVADKSAEANGAAAKANSEILRIQLETAQQAVHSSLEVGIRSFEGLTQNLTRALDVATPNRDLSEQSAQNVQAVSKASSALAKGAQDASRAWFELTQKTVRTNLQAFGRLAGCRTLQDVAALQSNLLRDNLQLVIESSDIVARTQSDALKEATRAIQPRAQPAA